MPSFHDKFKSIVVASGHSANAVAKLSGVPQTSVSAYLRGEGKPLWKHVQKLARAMGVSCIDLQDDGAPPAPKKKKKK